MFEGLFNFANLSNHLILVGIFVILALSLNLINGSLGAFSLGHHAFWGMGAYVAGSVVWALGTPDGGFVPWALSFPLAMLAAALFGVLVGVPCLRLRGDYLAIVTLGFAEIFVIFVRNSESWKNLLSAPAGAETGPVRAIFAERGLGGAAGFSMGDGFKGGNDFVLSLMSRMLGPEQAIFGKNLFYLILTWLLVAATYLVIRNLLRSAHGRAILAIREDETAAELLGVNLTRYKVLAFVTGAAFAGLAGALYANYLSNVSPNSFLLMNGIKILLMVVLGGLGSMSGTFVAVMVLYASEQALSTLSMRVPFPAYTGGGFEFADLELKELWQVIFSLVLVLLMLMRPQGIMGREEFSRAWVRKILAEWRKDPVMPVLTAAQWLQLLVVLAANRNPWVLLGSLLAVVGCQFFKLRRRTARLRAAAEGGARA
ncbi:MAG: branched-chain amino acid ABC transporter permease [Planctomycetota bacterium]|nr:branched-chain amino acid ABC transporter permease [Planctomycetota bacterium]